MCLGESALSFYQSMFVKFGTICELSQNLLCMVGNLKTIKPLGITCLFELDVNSQNHMTTSQKINLSVHEPQ